jgi:hypothetical protein
MGLYEDAFEAPQGGLYAEAFGSPQGFQPKPITVGRVLKGAVRDIPEIAKGAWDLASSNPVDLAISAGKAVLDPKTWQAAKERVSSLTAREVLEAAADNPIDTALLAAPVLGAAGKVAKLGGLAKTASVLEAGAALPANSVRMVGKGLAAAGKATVESLPEKLVTSAVKLPLSKKWVKATIDAGTGEVVTDRKRAVQAILQNGWRPNEGGIQEALNFVQKQHETVNAMAAQGAQEGKIVSVADALEEGMKGAYADAAKSPNASKARAVLDNWKANYLADHGLDVPVDTGIDLKRGLWGESRWTQTNKSASWRDRVLQGAYKGVGNAIKRQTEDLLPGVAELNAQEGAGITALEALTRAVPRIGNHDLVGLAAKFIYGVNHPGMAVVEAVGGLPWVKVTGAQALYQTGKTLRSAGEGIGSLAERLGSKLDSLAAPRPVPAVEYPPPQLALPPGGPGTIPMPDGRPPLVPPERWLPGPSGGGFIDESVDTRILRDRNLAGADQFLPREPPYLEAQLIEDAVPQRVPEPYPQTLSERYRKVLRDAPPPQTHAERHRKASRIKKGK